MDNDGYLLKRVGNAFFWNSALLPTIGATTLVGSIFIARWLTLEAFAIYSIANAMISSLLLYGDFGIGVGVSKFVPELVSKKAKGEVERLLFFLVFLKTIIYASIFVLILGFLDLVSGLLKIKSEYHFIFYFVGIILVFDSIYHLLHNFLWSTFEQKKANSISLFFSVAQPVLIIFFILADKGVRGILWAMVICSFSRMVFFSVVSKQKIKNLESDKTREGVGSYGYRFIRIALSTYFIRVTEYFISIPFITLILAYFLGNREVAIFALAAEFVMRFLSLSLTPTHGWILPLFTTIFNIRDEVMFRNFFSNTVKILTLLSIPIGGFLFSFSEYLIPLLYSGRFSGSVPLANILIIFIFLTYSTFAASNAAILSGEKLRIFLLVRLTPVLLTPLYLVIIPEFGLMGGAYFFGGTRLIMSILLLVVSMKSYDFEYPYLFCSKVFVGVIVSCITVMGLIIFGKGDLYVLGVGVILFLGILLSLLKVLKVIDENEKEIIHKMDIPILKYVLRYA
ncbi:MAG: lipopolysaccharide biosynthesis protein [Candidatus Hodarchaeales archaeon]|jgi:O-antigen/teichoic acid export membrane protein